MPSLNVSSEPMLHRCCNLLPRTSLKSGQIQVTHVEAVILLNHAIWLLRRMTSPVLERVFAGLLLNHLKTRVDGILGRDVMTRRQTRCRWDSWVDHIHATPVCG